MTPTISSLTDAELRRSFGGAIASSIFAIALASTGSIDALGEEAAVARQDEAVDACPAA